MYLISQSLCLSLWLILTWKIIGCHGSPVTLFFHDFHVLFGMKSPHKAYTYDDCMQIPHLLSQKLFFPMGEVSVLICCLFVGRPSIRVFFVWKIYQFSILSLNHLVWGRGHGYLVTLRVSVHYCYVFCFLKHSTCCWKGLFVSAIPGSITKTLLVFSKLSFKVNLSVEMG